GGGSRGRHAVGRDGRGGGRRASRDQQRRHGRDGRGPQFVLHAYRTERGPPRWHRDDYAVVELLLPAMALAQRMGAPMDSAELRELQQPLKDAYREDAEKAVATLRARGQLDDAICCSVGTGRALAGARVDP